MANERWKRRGNGWCIGNNGTQGPPPGKFPTAPEEKDDMVYKTLARISSGGGPAFLGNMTGNKTGLRAVGHRDGNEAGDAKGKTVGIKPVCLPGAEWGRATRCGPVGLDGRHSEGKQVGHLIGGGNKVDNFWGSGVGRPGQRFGEE